MLKREEVYWDVSLAMRTTVVEGTGFSYDDYTADIVPAKPPRAGMRANLNAWRLILGRVIHRIEREREEYRGLGVSEAEIKKSRTTPLSRTNSLLTDKILARLAELTTEEETPR